MEMESGSTVVAVQGKQGEESTEEDRPALTCALCVNPPHGYVLSPLVNCRAEEEAQELLRTLITADHS